MPAGGKVTVKSMQEGEGYGQVNMEGKGHCQVNMGGRSWSGQHGCGRDKVNNTGSTKYDTLDSHSSSWWGRGHGQVNTVGARSWSGQHGGGMVMVRSTWGLP